MRTLLYVVAMRLYALARPNTSGVKGIVVDDRGRVLLVRHTYVNGWHLPGGGLKRGEADGAALARELDEEVGVVIGSSPTILGRYGTRISGRRDALCVYVVTDWQQGVHGNLEIAEARFFDANNLPKATTPATRRRLAEWRGQVPVRPEW